MPEILCIDGPKAGETVTIARPVFQSGVFLVPVVSPFEMRVKHVRYVIRILRDDDGRTYYVGSSENGLGCPIAKLIDLCKRLRMQLQAALSEAQNGPRC